MAAAAASYATSILSHASPKPSQFPPTRRRISTVHHAFHRSRPTTNIPIPSKLRVSSPADNTTATATATPPPSKADGRERIFFDGGAHYGDLVANLLLGFTLLWLPLTIAAIFRAFFLRYRFTNLRVTVISGLTGQDRSDFPYSAIKDVQVVPRFIGEWGDVVITLTDGTKVDLRSVPKFREIADYCLYMADQDKAKGRAGKGF